MNAFHGNITLEQPKIKLQKNKVIVSNETITLHKFSLKYLLSYIHTYPNYTNIAWASTQKTN